MGQVLLPRGWNADGQGRWVRKKGDFDQQVDLQPSQWNKASNYVNCTLWYRKLERAKAGGARDNFHMRERPGNLDARRASRLEKCLLTDATLTETSAWLARVDSLLTTVCLPWLERIDSLEAVTEDIRRHHPHLWVAPALAEVMERKRTRTREVATPRARRRSSR
jgi:hypothetical protein